MTDLANLVLAVDSTSVPKAVASLDGLTAAGARAEAATLGLGGGFKGAGAEATAMAAAAQLSARAAVDQAAGFGKATSAAKLNTLAMRETLVVAREISRGNFTRLPGSLTLLAQGVGSQGGIGAYASAISQQLGLIRQVQNAELAEAATAAATAAAGVEAAARKAGANVLAADTEVALAEAQARTAEGAVAEAAAQARLAAALEGVTAASAEATIAENALAVAQGRAAETGAASAAATKRVIGTTGAGLIGLVIAAAGAEGAFKALQATVDDNGALDRYAASLVKTKEQLKDLEDKVGGFQVTWGDVFHGIGKAASDALDSSIWDAFKEGNKKAFTDALHNAVDFAAKSYGVVRGSYQTIVDDWSKFPAVLGDAFYSAVNIAISALNKLVKFGADQLNSLIAGVNNIPGVNIGKITAAQIGAVGNPYAGLKLDSDLHGNINKFTKEGRARINAGLSTIYDDIIGAAEDRIKGGLPKGRQSKPKKESDHGLQESLDKLDAEIKGQYALAAAYQVSDAAAQRAAAAQKAAEDAIQHKGKADQFYAKELQKAVAEDVARQAKSNAALQFETSTRAQLNAQVAAGTLDVSQYNDALKLQTTLHKLNSDLENADAAHKQTIRDLIKQTIDLEGEQLALESQLSALKQIAANDNDIARMQLENSLMGASNKERAVAIAQLEAMQQLKTMPGLSVGEQRDYLQSAVAKAQASVQTPFQQWARDIPQTADAINEALQSIEFKGFDSLASGIADVINGTKSLGAVFKDIAHQIIADLIQMTIKMLIFKTLTSIFGGGGGGGLGGGGTGILGSIIGGKLATGGPANAGQTYLVGENGPELFRPSSSGTVIPNGHMAANNNQSGPIEVHILVDTSENLETKVDAKIAGGMQQAVAVSVNHMNQTIKSIARPKLMGGR